MKKIGTYNWRFDIADAVKEVIPTALDSGVDIYKEDDGSVRIFPHKISFVEAEGIAIKWLVENKAYNPNTSDSNVTYFSAFSEYIILCAYRHYGEIKTGVAKFNNKDYRYSYAIGKALAYSRASGKKLPADLATYLGIKQ